MRRNIFLRSWIAAALAAGLALPVQAATSQSSAALFVPDSNEFASAVVMVPTSHQLLYSFKPDLPHVAASLTKLPNALVMVHRATSWDRLVRMSRADEVGGGRLRVKSGARLTMRDLLYSAITASANNAAMALARLSGLARKTFLTKMNTLAKKAGAAHSKFVDPSGMDPGNTTTARDMALIAEAAFRDPLIHSAASAKQYHFTVVNTGQQKTITSTNRLLTGDSEVWVYGGKTGYLEESQYNLVVELRPLDPNGQPVYAKDVIVVVMGAPTKDGSFATAKRLAEWAWQNYEF